MAPKYLVTLDRTHLRIYRYSQQPGQLTPSIQPVDAPDIPTKPNSYAVNETVGAGGLPGFAGGLQGTSADLRRPVQEDGEGRVVELLAERIANFLEAHPHSVWNMAATSGLRDEVIQALPEQARLRLDQVVERNLINVPPAELREHFSLR
jgi:Protein required for attachment to host cells